MTRSDNIVDQSSSWNHRYPLKVRGYELDSYRHVNHAIYLSYLEQARWDYLASRGLSLKKLDEIQRWPVVVHLEIDYLKSALMDDELVIFSRLTELGRASMEIEHEIQRAGQTITRAKIRAAIIDGNGRAAALPDEYRKLAEKEIYEP